MFRHLAATALASLAIVAPGSAQTYAMMTPSPRPAPDAGYDRISAGKLQQAEIALLSARTEHPQAPEIALNLAVVYVMTGRAQLAVPLYAEVLAEKAVLMDMPSGAIVSSHDVARKGASKVSAQYAAR